jgi:hypothetical protein
MAITTVMKVDGSSERGNQSGKRERGVRGWQEIESYLMIFLFSLDSSCATFKLLQDAWLL